MNVLVINQFGHNMIKSCKAIPNVGSKVNMDIEIGSIIFTVSNVLYWPSQDTLKQLNIINTEIEAIITVE